MPKTVVGLFENSGLVDDVVREIEALGFPRQEVRTLQEPTSFEVTGVMSFPRIDFEVDMGRELTRIGATESETQAYIDGLRRGGALAFATGPEEQVNAAADVMSRHGAVNIEKVNGAEPQLPGVVHPNRTPLNPTPSRDGAVQAGRIRDAGTTGPAFFTW